MDRRGSPDDPRHLGQRQGAGVLGVAGVGDVADGAGPHAVDGDGQGPPEVDVGDQLAGIEIADDLVGVARRHPEGAAPARAAAVEAEDQSGPLAAAAVVHRIDAKRPVIAAQQRRRGRRLTAAERRKPHSGSPALRMPSV